ncbi:MAG: uracil-DNA glycosylase family protein [Alphaproteobacteria bacterium]
MYYRGRLDGSAKVLVIGQDPAADENVARRILVGDAGQRVQGFLAKLGITRSYVMVNSVLYSIFGQFDNDMKAFVDLPAVQQWRNNLLNALKGPNIQAVLAFGQAARHVRIRACFALLATVNCQRCQGDRKFQIHFGTREMVEMRVR